MAKPYKTISLRLDSELAEELQEYAEQTERTLAASIRYLCRSGVKMWREFG